MLETLAYRTPSLVRESSQGICTLPINDELFSQREIELVGVVDSDMTYSLCQQLRYLWKDDPNAEIAIFINSPGGSIVDGMAIYDVMRAISCPIRTICLGQATSMAALLFVAGDTREMLPHASIMIHDPLIQGGLGGSALAVKASADHLMRMRDLAAAIIARHTGHRVEEVLALTARDTYFEAPEAVAWGLADRVIETF